MTHLGTQYIETDRLILRRFELLDAQAMFDNWASDNKVTKCLTWPTCTDVSTAKQISADWTGRHEKDDCFIERRDG